MVVDSHASFLWFPARDSIGKRSTQVLNALVQLASSGCWPLVWFFFRAAYLLWVVVERRLRWVSGYCRGELIGGHDSHTDIGWTTDPGCCMWGVYHWWLLATNEKVLFIIVWKRELKAAKEHISNAEYISHWQLLVLMGCSIHLHPIFVLQCIAHFCGR